MSRSVDQLIEPDPNALVVAGALFALLSEVKKTYPALTEVEVGSDYDRLNLQFDFMKSKYELFVRRLPE